MEFSIKQRTYVVFGELLTVIVAMFFVWLGFTDVKKYLTFPDAINYAPMAVYCLVSPLFTLPLISFGILPIFKGRRFSYDIQKLITKLLVVGAVLALVAAAIFRYWYLGELENRSYIKCSNLPLNYTPGPGGATRYVLDRSLCHD
jgi:hypothetical protein